MASVNQPMHFPPPPRYVTNEEGPKKSLKINFSKPRSSNVDSCVTNLQPTRPTQSILKRNVTSTKRQRQYILFSILILTFTILILSVIFAYCAALPHSTKTNVSTSTTSSDESTARLLLRDYSSAMSSSASGNDSNIDTDVILAEQQEKSVTFSQPSAMAALTFYTALLPFLTLLHTVTELLISLVRPATSQQTRLGDILQRRDRRVVEYDNDISPRQEGKAVMLRRRFGVALSFIASLLLACGWVVIEMVWVNCEIKGFHDAKGTGRDDICPVQIRGHRMGGVSELSIGKVVLTAFVILGYMAYCGFLVLRVGIRGGGTKAGRVVRLSGRRARFTGRLGKVEEKGDDEDVERIVVKNDEMPRSMR